MLILSFSIEGISWFSTNLPLRIFIVIKLISGYIIGAFGSLFTKTINNSHLFINKFFRLSLSCRSSKRKFRCRWFLTIFNITKSRINLSIRKFNKILISIYFFLLFILSFIFLCIHSFICY